MTALIDITLIIDMQKDQRQRQYEAERQKSSTRCVIARTDTSTAKREGVLLHDSINFDYFLEFGYIFVDKIEAL